MRAIKNSQTLHKPVLTNMVHVSKHDLDINQTMADFSNENFQVLMKTIDEKNLIQMV